MKSSYGTLLKSLINFSGSKLSTVAETVGYDVSYLSKWCNKAKLPAAKMAPNINRALADHFSREIIRHDDLEAFSKTFSVDVNEMNLSTIIYDRLKEAYKESGREVSTTTKTGDTYPTRVLSLANDVYEFFNHELFEILTSYDEALDVLCTFDIGRFISNGLVEDPSAFVIPKHEVSVKIGLNLDTLLENPEHNLENLYFFINAHGHINFDFYNDKLMHSMNTVVVKNHMAILLSLDQYNRIVAATVITDPEKVNQIYIRTLPAFRTPDLLIHATESDEFYQHGYRTDFYARDNYQILLAHGFEYLLPTECIDSIVDAARIRDNDEFMAHLVSQLQITWEEVFEKNHSDFFVLKSSLLKYIEDGELIFTDVVYNMSPEQRKLHIQKVLDITRKNPNIRFYVIDEEYLPNIQHLLHTSVFTNRKKMFLKNPGRYHSTVGPHLYSILSDVLIQEICAYFDNLHTRPFCFTYDADRLEQFYEKYGSLIERMIDLSNFK